MLEHVYREGKKYRERVGKEISQEGIAEQKRELKVALKGKRLLIYHPMSKKRWVI